MRNTYGIFQSEAALRYGDRETTCRQREQLPVFTAFTSSWSHHRWEHSFRLSLHLLRTSSFPYNGWLKTHSIHHYSWIFFPPGLSVGEIRLFLSSCPYFLMALLFHKRSSFPPGLIIPIVKSRLLPVSPPILLPGLTIGEMGLFLVISALPSGLRDRTPSGHPCPYFLLALEIRLLLVISTLTSFWP